MQLTALSLALTRIGLGGFGVGSSLNLDFTSGNRTLDPRITFSHASNATVVGPDGTLQYAPHNLLTFSEQFDNAAWSKAAATVFANAGTAPDGASTADRISDTVDVGNAVHTVSQSVAWLTGTTYTLSVYGKAGTLTGLHLLLPSNSFGVDTRANFDLTNGTAQVVAGTASASITLVAEGYYRCSITATTTAASTASFQIRTMKLVSGSLTSFYQGDGAGTLFYWGAQLNVGPLQPYYPTTVKNLLGFTQEFDNAAWTKSNSFVQTNLLTWSEQFDNAAWTKTELTVSANQAVAPDGTLSADQIVESTTVAATHVLFQNAGSSATHTLSVYVKANGRSWVNLRISGTSNYFNISTGVLGTIAVGNTAAITFVGGGWYKCSVTATMASSGAVGVRLSIADGNDIYTGDGASGLFIWGAQLVQGSTPGDYQRTEGTTRAVMYPAPDGSRTADKLVEDTTANAHYAAQTFTASANAVYTYTLYAKAAERSVLQIVLTSGAFGANFAGVFNLSNGQSSLGAGGTNASVSMTDVGNGWYRCSVKAQATSGVLTGPQLRVMNSYTTVLAGYTGDGTSGIYIWGAQLSDSASLDPYVYNPGAAPAAAAYYGPRFDYDPVTLAPKGLLIEEQRTNSIRNNTMQGAVAGTPGTLPTNWTYTGGGLTANVIGTGVEAGINYVDIQFVGTATSGSSGLRFEGTSGVSASTGQTWNSSIFIRRVAGSTSGLAGGVPLGLNLTYLVSGAGSDSASTSIGFDSLEVAAISQNRVLVTATGASAGITTIRPQVILGHTVGNAIDITLRIGMPQLEQGAFATSVIPTSGAAATRAADVAVMQGANFSNWYRQDELGVYVEYSGRTGGRAFMVDDGTTNNRFEIRITSNTSQLASWSGGVQDIVGLFAPGAVGLPDGVTVKTAIGLKANDAAISTNAFAVGTDTSCAMPVAPNRMILGSFQGTATFLNGHIRKIAYFPRRLSNAELQGITS